MGLGFVVYAGWTVSAGRILRLSWTPKWDGSDSCMGWTGKNCWSSRTCIRWIQSSRSYPKLLCLDTLNLKRYQIPTMRMRLSPLSLSRSISSLQVLFTQASTSQQVSHVPVLTQDFFLGLVSQLCSSGKLIAAMGVMRSLRSPMIYNVLLEMAGRRNSIDIVSQYFKELLRLPSESMSSYSFTMLARAFSVENDDARLLMFAREVSDLSFPRNVLVINRILVAFADCGQIDMALMIFDHMRGFNCQPNILTYNTIMGGLGHCGRIDEMLHVFTSMQEAHISPDIVSFNTILNSLKKVGRLQLILVYFKQIIQRGVQPDLRTYTALIDGFGRSGNVEESLRLFEEMKCSRICPSIYIYRSLLDSSKKSGKLESAIKLLEEMNSSISHLVGPKDFKKRRVR